MAVLDSERQVAPRSAFRYQPITSDQATGPVLARSRRVRTDVPAAKAVPDALDLDKDEEHPPYRRRVVVPSPRQSAIPPARTRRSLHPLFLMGVGLCLALGLWVGISQAINWGTNEINTLKYGYPRTFQMDAVLGHNDLAAHPSHLTAINLHGQILIIEIPGGDATHSRIYVGPQLLGANSDLIPITLQLIDPGHTGKPDLVIDAAGLQSILVNTGSGFRAPTTAEQQQLLPGVGGGQ